MYNFKEKAKIILYHVKLFQECLPPASENLSNLVLLEAVWGVFICLTFI